MKIMNLARAILTVAALLCCRDAFATAATGCTKAEIDTAVAATSTGGTVTLPACNVTWTTTLTISKAITLQGNGIGSTIINDNADGVSLFVWNCEDGQAHRMTGIEFRDGGYSPRQFTGRIKINCFSTTNTTFRIDHNKFDHLNDFPFYTYDLIGVADNNIFLQTGSTNPFYIFDPVWKGVGAYGDNSWAQPVVWGSLDAFYIETNTITWDAGSTYTGCWDGYMGMRAVARFNTTTGCNFEMHGTETGQRYRGARYNEIYKNNMNAGGDFSPQIVAIADIRSGAVLGFDNVMTNVPTGYSGYRFANVVDDRTSMNAIPWGAADGRNGLDVNASVAVGGTQTAASGGSLTVTVSGTPWTLHQWDGYLIRKIGCFLTTCASFVTDTTTNTVTFNSTANDGHGPNLSFTGSDTFEFNTITETLDQPGRGLGTLLVNKTCSSLTSVGTAATATCASHGFSTGNWVIMNDDLGLTGFQGFVQITVTGANTFTYTCPTTCGSNSSGQANLSPSANDQADFPSYEINNTLNGTLRHINQHGSCGPSCRENEHYYNYTSGFDGTAGTGRGTRAARPASTTNGVAYYSTDMGTNWDTTNGSGNDGCLDVVESGAWVDCKYNFPTYPHYLTTGGDSTPPTAGNSGTITFSGVTSSAITVNWTKGTDETTAQGSLTYEVCRSLSAISSTGTCESNIVMSFTTDVATYADSGLSASTTYHYNVVVKDAAGNKTLYVDNSQATSATSVAVIASVLPVSGGRGKTVAIVVTGTNTNFQSNVSVCSFSPASGITVTSTTVASATSATCNVTIANGAALSSRTMRITTGSEYADLASAFQVIGGGTQLRGLRR